MNVTQSDKTNYRKVVLSRRAQISVLLYDKRDCALMREIASTFDLLGKAWNLVVLLLCLWQEGPPNSHYGLSQIAVLELIGPFRS